MALIQFTCDCAPKARRICGCGTGAYKYPPLPGKEIQYQYAMEPVKPEIPHPPTDGTPPRKPYLKPSFIFERAFETMALACGKIGASQAQCKTNRKNS